MLEYASVGSGSSGNATLVRAGEVLVLVDCGFSLRELRRRMVSLGCVPEDIDAILVTHEHSDHIKGVRVLARDCGIPVYGTIGTLRQLLYRDDVEVVVCRHYVPFHLGALEILPVPVPHDAADPLHFLFRAGSTQFSVLTDLGHVPESVVDNLLSCDGLLLEFNHDLGMLREGPYPLSLKRRIASDLGHLNNIQASDLLRRLRRGKLSSLAVGHISARNNSPVIINDLLRDALRDSPVRPLLATQHQGFSWLPAKVSSEYRQLSAYGQLVESLEQL